MDPVALDFGGLVESLDAELAGLDAARGQRRRPGAASSSSDKLATAVVSCDSPRFLSFIPAAPTKASLLFDMFVSCSSLHGTSWLEAAGVVVAENQALGVLAAQAGLPEGAGGCFVAGGSAGNLSALMVARDTAAHRRRDEPAAASARVAMSEDAHSSVGKALHVSSASARSRWRRSDHRLTGARAPCRAARRSPRRDDVIGVVATAGTTNAGIVDDLAGVADVAAERSLWFHIDGAYGGAAALFAPSVRAQFAGFGAGRLVHRRSPQVALRSLRLRRPDLPPAQPGQGRAHPGRPVPRGAAQREPRGVEPERLRLPPHPTGPGAAAVVLPGRQRPRRLSRRRRGGAGHRPSALRSGSAESPHVELVREPGLSIVLFRRPGWGKDRLRGVVGPSAAATDRLRHADQLGRRDSGPFRLPPPRHHRGDGRRDPRLNGRAA